MMCPELMPLLYTVSENLSLLLKEFYSCLGFPARRKIIKPSVNVMQPNEQINNLNLHSQADPVEFYSAIFHGERSFHPNVDLDASARIICQNKIILFTF